MISPSEFKDALGNAVSSVTLVTLPASSDNPSHGITVSAFSSVSLEPPLVMICLDHETTAHQRLSTDTDSFCVNVLSAHQRDAAEYFAGMSDDDAAFEFEGATTARTGAPVLDDTIAYFDCHVNAVTAAGDHHIYVGRVVDVEVVDEEAPQLGYFRGDWYTVQDAVSAREEHREAESD